MALDAPHLPMALTFMHRGPDVFTEPVTDLFNYWIDISSLITIVISNLSQSNRIIDYHSFNLHSNTHKPTPNLNNWFHHLSSCSSQNLRVILDSSLLPFQDPNTQPVMTHDWFSLENTSHIQPFLSSIMSPKTTVSFLSGLWFLLSPTIHSPQLSERFCFIANHVSPLVKFLQWLPITLKIKLKLVHSIHRPYTPTSLAISSMYLLNSGTVAVRKTWAKCYQEDQEEKPEA